MKRTRSIETLASLLALLLGGDIAIADLTNTTPHDYDRPPRPGVERGTYAFNGSGAGGPDCYFTITGTAKFLPNAEGTGGDVCAKGNIELRGTGPGCALAPLVESSLAVLVGPYAYNGDGTLCENLHVVGGPLDGMAATFHTYVEPKGRMILPTAQDIAYACPGIVPNGQVIAEAVGFKISRHGDDPPGSGTLGCTNP